MPDFKTTQDDWDRTRWVGTGFITETPGGGNADFDGDRDPIEQVKHPKARIVGPEGLLPEGNS
jgi:hypothetical protein